MEQKQTSLNATLKKNKLGIQSESCALHILSYLLCWRQQSCNSLGDAGKFISCSGDEWNEKLKAGFLNGAARAERCSDLPGPAGDEQPKRSEKPEAPGPLRSALLQGLPTSFCRWHKRAVTPFTGHSTSVSTSSASFCLCLFN